MEDAADRSPGETDDTPTGSDDTPTGSDDTPTGPDDPQPAIRRIDDSEASENEGNVAGMLARDQPLEPGDIDLENAFFVLLGVVFVTGFLVLAIQGL